MTDSGVKHRTPELMAPAGDRDCLLAAVDNGADAVYFGLASGFNARARAANHSIDDLPDLMTLLHRRGVKGYVTLNTLVFPDELETVASLVRRIAESGADALIVQDLGVARIAKEICAELPLHASTQMSLSSAEGIRAAESLGIARVILARELPIEELAAIRRETALELEVFVHGALCVSYSGQCLASAAFGGRSANRGQCAQPCRLAYEWVTDAPEQIMADRAASGRLFSPRDLSAVDLIPQLMAAGIDAFKIEGRMKTAEYVTCVTRIYRAALDAAAAGEPSPITAEQIHDMELAFSRGASHGWLEGRDPLGLVPGNVMAKCGIRLGEVTGVRRGRMAVRLETPLRRGDGVAFGPPDDEAQRQGGRVFEIFRGRESLREAAAGETVELTFGRDAIDWSAVWPGIAVWKTDDPTLGRRLRQALAQSPLKRRLPLDLRVEARVGGPVVVTAAAAAFEPVRLKSADPLVQAERRPTSVELLREQFGRLGNTPFELRELSAEIVGEPMIPLSVLGQLRREMVERLTAILEKPPKRMIAHPTVLGEKSKQMDLSPLFARRCSVLCRNEEQVEAALACDVDELIVDFLDIDSCAAAVRKARDRGVPVLLATPRLHRRGENRILESLAAARPDGLLVRNLASLDFATSRGLRAVADWSLNAANALSADWLIGRGAERVAAALELDERRLESLARSVMPGQLEAVIWSHLPLFHTEYCPFCGLFSKGTGPADCGRPCRRNELRLRDRLGVEHFVAVDAGCRTTVFHARPTDLADSIARLLQCRVGWFRVELPPTCDRRRAAETIRRIAERAHGAGGI